MSIDQLTPERRAIAERSAAIVKACIGGVALSEALKNTETELLKVASGVALEFAE